ncbi:uncharacterized protein TRUGW13939_01699 [Talaromyces rugulosus]|uniref:Uncharacterized protein n=1 Tax=Talaromyces rugulosus TaxID=121627 RepID=A0A7H8QM53_TALRU|nr:uncharacterized protein TRUGW13939_01699 [Talaromyces rugulosus]QKX54611.1 hypothetical protein TRUGW13939_01699 [Talaromyces rugulosus]
MNRRISNRPQAVLLQMEDDILWGNEDSFQEGFSRLAHLGEDRQRELVEQHCLLHQAAEQNSLPIVNLLFSLKLDANGRNLKGETALHIAAASRSENAPKIVTAMIHHGANVNLRDARQWLPLHRAVANHAAENANRLIDAGAEVNATVPEVGAPIYLALNLFQDFPTTAVEVISKLLTARADPNSKDHHGNAPLHMVHKGEWQIVNRLLAAGADPNAQDDEGDTPLHIATKNRDYPLAETEAGDENSAPKQVTLGQLTKATYSPTVYDMLYDDALLKGILDTSSGFRWIHLPFTILWVDHLIDAICRFNAHINPSETNLSDSADIKRFIVETFNETGLVTGYRQPGFVIEHSVEKQIPYRVSLALPLIDVDYSINEKARLKAEVGMGRKEDSNHQKHIQAMKELKYSYRDSCCKLHSPRTLDESSYDFLEDNDLESRDQGQVLTVYLDGQKTIAESGSSTPGLKPFHIRHGSMLPKPENREGAMTDSPRHMIKNAKLAAHSASTDREKNLISPQMLMVPQLWLWKIDERTIISAFPERWDSRYGQSMFDKVRNELQFAATVEDVIVKIADTCINYIEDSWYVSEGRGYTTFDAFDYAIAGVSNEVTKCYERFEKLVGSSNKNIHPEVQNGAGLLKKISDVIDEIGIIKRVLNDQSVAMKNILRWRSKLDGSANVIHETNYVHYPLERFTRLEQNASSVRNSLITLLDIWQRESIIDDAQEESRQSRVLFVFTAITVCFLPLSFIGQLLALPIRGLGLGESYTPAWVLEVEVITMMVTLIAIISLFWMCFGLPEYVKKIWKCISPSASHPGSAQNKAPGTKDRKKKSESRQTHAKLSSLLCPRLRNKRQTKTQRDLENGTGRVGDGRYSKR